MPGCSVGMCVCLCQLLLWLLFIFCCYLLPRRKTSASHTHTHLFVVVVLNNYRAKKTLLYYNTLSLLSIKLEKKCTISIFLLLFSVNLYARARVCVSACLFVYVYIKYLTNNFRLSVTKDHHPARTQRGVQIFAPVFFLHSI